MDGMMPGPGPFMFEKVDPLFIVIVLVVLVVLGIVSYFSK